jgi:hypothetical protein
MEGGNGRFKHVNTSTKTAEEYEPKTLLGISGSFERYLKRHYYEYSIITSFEFAQCRDY